MREILTFFSLKFTVQLTLHFRGHSHLCQNGFINFLLPVEVDIFTVAPQKQVKM